MPTPDSPAPAAGEPQNDAEVAPAALMTLPGPSRDRRHWRLIEIRRQGRWQPAMLTVWRRPPGSLLWVVHVMWSSDPDSGWGWFVYSEASIRPVPDPGEAAPAGAPFFGRWHDAVAVPRELAPPPGADPGDQERWQLAWIRVDGAWRSGLVTAVRRPAPTMPWIAYCRWGEDKQVAWLVHDGQAVRLAANTESAHEG
ncbi:hypothetical protein ACFU7Y_05805 [Kitasatospora sp. NPDC057542]|uniref:hypothetical protein n=1 Tax=Streptomycetaceae TaxID=2062 RepID=UPI001CCDF285|nr:hypothetical protein [Streptomyces sp. LS1784]